MDRYTPRTKKGVSSHTESTPKQQNDLGLLGNYECRKVVYAFLVKELNVRPASTKDKDLVELLEDITGPAPDDIDDVADAYVWMVLTLVDAGKLVLPKLALKGWSTQSRYRLIRAFIDNAKQNSDEE